MFFVIARAERQVSSHFSMVESTSLTRPRGLSDVDSEAAEVATGILRTWMLGFILDLTYD